MPLTGVFADLLDSLRDTLNKLHELTDILVIIIVTAAVLGGAERWEAIAEFGRTKEPIK